ncbi:choice-of-anchor J domain-containing protein [Bacteroidales bacterium OttesenSCG-928-I14]|nr:choice-of-anchor J domain-containing protein [Bacteroidales bacterium OttesenSCG-928-I14]
MRKITLLLTLAILALVGRAQDNTTLYGVCVNDSNADKFEIVKFNSNDPATLEVLKANPVTEEGTLSAQVGSYGDGYIYMYTINAKSITGFAKVSVLDWTTTKFTPFSSAAFVPSDMAYNPVTNKLYAVTVNFTNLLSDITEIDMNTGETSLAVTLDYTFGCIAFDEEGKLYGITQDLAMGGVLAELRSIDFATGVSTPIVSLGMMPVFIQSMTYDNVSKKIYYAYHAAGHSKGDLIEIDPVSAEFENLGKIGNNSRIVGLFTTLLPSEYAPANGSDEANALVKPTITFNRDIEAGDLSLVSISPEITGVSASIEGNTLVVAHDKFAYSTEYTVNVPKEAVKGLDVDLSWSFTTMLDPGECNAPSQLKVSDIEAYNAVVTWQENGTATAWNVKYGEKGFDVETEGLLISEVDELSCPLTGLNESTNYDVYVQAICDPSNPSDWSTVCSFMTPKDCALAHSTFPWFEDFEGESFPSECWTSYNRDEDEDIVWENIPNEEWAYSGKGAAYHNFDIYKPQEGWLVTNKFAIPEGDDTYILRFLNMNKYPEDYVYNGVWISEGSPDPEDGDFVEVWTAVNVLNEWTEEKVNLSEHYAGKDIYIAFVYKAKGDILGAISQRWIIDNVSIDTYDYTDLQLISLDDFGEGGPNLPADGEVKVTLYNYGSKPVTGALLELVINGESVAKETIDEPISSLTYMQYTFKKKVDLSALGTYKVEIMLTQEGDMDVNNNDLSRNIVCIPEEHITFYGYCLMSFANQAYNFISFNTADLFFPEPLAMFYDEDETHIATAGEYLDGYFYMFTQTAEYTDRHLIQIDPKTWTEVSKVEVDFCPFDITYDYSTQTMYGVVPKGNKSDLYIIDESTGEMSFVAAINEYVFGLACDLDGTLYAVLTGGAFASVDKKTGALTFIGETGFPYAKYVQSMAFDHNTGRLFWALVGDGPNSGPRYGGLVEIDKTTGCAYFHDKISVNTQVVGLHTLFVNPNVGIDVVSEGKMSIYPNPSKGTIHLNITEDASLRVFDMTGKLVDSYEIDKSTNTLSLNLPNGLYMVQLIDGKDSYSTKLIIKK